MSKTNTDTNPGGTMEYSPLILIENIEKCIPSHLAWAMLKGPWEPRAIAYSLSGAACNFCLRPEMARVAKFLGLKVTGKKREIAFRITSLLINEWMQSKEVENV